MKRLGMICVLLIVLAFGSVIKINSPVEYAAPVTVADHNTASDLYAFQLNCSVRVHSGHGWGSGVWVAPNIVLTAKHVVEGATELDIELYNGHKVKATQFVLDADDDLALIFVNFTSKHWAQLGARPLVGQEVTMIGTPLDSICRFNLTRGHVSALIKKVPDSYDPAGTGKPHFIVDCFGGPGNSGGPVFRGKEVIGLCIWGKGENGSSLSLVSDITHLDKCLRSTL